MAWAASGRDVLQHESHGLGKIGLCHKYRPFRLSRCLCFGSKGARGQYQSIAMLRAWRSNHFTLALTSCELVLLFHATRSDVANPFAGS